MKKILLFMVVFSVAAMLHAQPKTSSGFTAGSKTEGGVSVVLGVPFSSVFSGSGYEIAEGVAQAQLVTEAYGANVAYGAGYHDAWFDFDASTAVGIHYDKLYIPHGAPNHYDLLRKLTLNVLGSTACGTPVVDADGNVYNTVDVANYCWTQSNLRPRHYADASHTEIARAGIFNAPGFTDVVANENTYGRLYTWYSAVNLPEDGSGTLVPDANGYVQGICPTGWHIPTTVEKAALDALNTEDIRTAELWLSPNSNTNSTGFTSLPAGMYNAASGQYEQILMNTGYWSLSNGTSAPTTVMSLPYYCFHPIETPVSASDMLSVRCVKND
ncbi:MAG: fibrobacter succinogenes major paralogous domain-containing protein [Bacteroidales bacterium]|nr:fibrobacter succinogenes major paralogous domain-containing protein [Bacteroidales bacterium]